MSPTKNLLKICIRQAYRKKRRKILTALTINSINMSALWLLFCHNVIVNLICISFAVGILNGHVTATIAPLATPKETCYLPYDKVGIGYWSVRLHDGNGRLFGYTLDFHFKCTLNNCTVHQFHLSLLTFQFGNCTKFLLIAHQIRTNNRRERWNDHNANRLHGNGASYRVVYEMWMDT